MATILPAQPTAPSRARRRWLSETRLRALSATVIGLALATLVVGTAWDTQWHVAVGRDRALTAPHVMMLLGIALAGLVSLALVLADTWRFRRGSEVSAANSRRVLGIFQAPSGLVLAGIGALLAAIAFPLDDYWHTLYGIDVTLWAPFHVMIVASMVTSGLGALFLLAAEIRQAASARAQLGLELAFALGLAATWSTLLLLLPQANADDGLFGLGQTQLVWYPILLAGALPLAILPALRLTRLPAPASVVALIVVGLRQAMFWFVPWAVETTRAAEGLVYRPNPPGNVITPYAFPLALLFLALAIDGLAWALRSSARRPRLLLGATLAGAVLAGFLERPWIHTLTTYYFPSLDTGAALLNTMPLTVLGALAGGGLALALNRGLAAAKH
jgi:hypothetical protein